MAHVRLGIALAVSAGAAAPSAHLDAQTLISAGGRNEVFAGSEMEHYLRYLQSLGSAPLYPWSVRTFSPVEVDRLMTSGGGHPWASHFSFGADSGAGPHVSVVAPTADARYNSAFPFGSNDGPIWAGRGLTTSVQLGVSGRWGPFSVSVAPLLFRAENTPFQLQRNSDFEIVPGGPRYYQPYGDGVYPRDVDRPQRFGNKPYALLDPGQSYARVDWRIVSAGVSTANEWWGPANDYPLILGNNAAGFPHLFVGTGHPIDLYVATLHAKAMWGRLAQSSYSPVTGSDSYVDATQPGRLRFMSGAVVSVMPRGITGLEVGAARFFHSAWLTSGPTRQQILRPFENFLKSQLPVNAHYSDDQGDNQLLSVFFRWVLPHSGAELYGEFGREDHSYDWRDFLDEPDHSRMYNMGFRKVLTSHGTSFTALRGELINFQLPTLSRHRQEGAVYMHALLRQGHTNRGQLLGADVGVGAAAGSTVAVDHYHEHGRLTVSWMRDLRQESGDFIHTGVKLVHAMDVQNSLQVESVRFLDGFDLIASGTLTREFNRNFGTDENNLNVRVGAAIRRW